MPEFPLVQACDDVQSSASPHPRIQKYKPLRKPRNSTKLPLPELPSQVYLESVQSVDEIVLLLDSKSVPVELEESTLESLTEDILPPMFAVFHPTLVKWVRATQTSAINSQGLIPVLYTDYGTRGFGTEAKTIPSHLLSIPPRAISASLYEVQPIADNERLLATIKKTSIGFGVERYYFISVLRIFYPRICELLLFTNLFTASRTIGEKTFLEKAIHRMYILLDGDFSPKDYLGQLPKFLGEMSFGKFPLTLFTYFYVQSMGSSKESHVYVKLIDSNGNDLSEELVSSGLAQRFSYTKGKSCVLTENGNMLGSMPRSPTCKITTNGPLLSGLLNSGRGSPLEAKKWTKRKSLIRQTSLDSVKPGIVLEFKVSSNEKNVISAFTLKSREGDAYINSAMQKESHEKLNNFVKGDEKEVLRLVVYLLIMGSSFIAWTKKFAKISSGSIVAQVRHNVGGVILVDVEEKNASYLVIPFPYFDPETTMLFKYTSYEVPPSLSLKEKFKNHDEVNFLSFTEYANEPFFILNLDEYTLHEEPRKDEIYACKWSDDDCYYRAQVKAINKKSSKVKVFFIDYGNSAIQDFNRLSYLPKLLSTVAPFCSKVKLEGVSAKSAEESTMEKLRSELESISLNIQIENNYSTVTLLSCGNPVNNLIEAIINKDE
ncbi:unnamed protein product [Lepeophtheirus salmonis]|uniref:(salmon louse) hypothetical protein n=1 Tax=Lepeophtheirus salmonis TaxID=72036 RepID=A0A7R8H9J3_LEPSM|nr:unnamed protein product [Lepeophtheirus salmonis]CAF2950628.1 unnamed protein product [Lepeophtheirus salmonis]